MNEPEPTLFEFPFPNALEASAYTVLAMAMIGEDCLKCVERMPDDTFKVTLKKPVPMEVHMGMMLAIQNDKKNNPQKWANSLAEIEGRRHEQEDV